MNRLEEIKARCEAATEGPWSKDNFYRAAVNDGSHEKWIAPKYISEGECCFCANKENVLVESYSDAEGNWHVHKIPSDNWRLISSVTTLDTIIGNYDFDHGGVASTEADSEFIAHAREDIPYLLEKIGHLQEVVDQAVEIIHMWLYSQEFPPPIEVSDKSRKWLDDLGYSIDE